MPIHFTSWRELMLAGSFFPNSSEPRWWCSALGMLWPVLTHCTGWGCTNNRIKLKECTAVFNLYAFIAVHKSQLSISLSPILSVCWCQTQPQGILDSPVTVQAVGTNGRIFQFMVFQLNTTDLSGDDGIKNQVLHTPFIMNSMCSVVVVP